MTTIPVVRRLLLKASLAAVLGLTTGDSFAAILQAGGGGDAKGPGRDGLLAAQSRLGASLIRYLADHHRADIHASPNLIVSPASLAAILSFVDLGANPLMHTAIHRTLGFGRAGRRRADDDIRALRDGVSAIIARSAQDGPLVLANLLAFDRATRPRQLALLGLSGAGADVLVDDLGDEGIIDRINNWVKQKTRDLIPSIIEEAPAALGLVAVNALYFKDRWQLPFDAARTGAEKFQPVSGAPADVPMMHSPVATFSFRQDDRFVAADLAYASADFKLVVVTTMSAPAPASDFAAVADWLSGQGFEAKTGEIGLPKLQLSATEELLSPLDALGLRAARRRRDALEEFSAEDLIITRVVQKLELRLSEEGTEAAAATAVVTTRSLGTPGHVKMVVDKPFVFALRDQKTGLILFMGYVGAPPK